LIGGSLHSLPRCKGYAGCCRFKRLDKSSKTYPTKIRLFDVQGTLHDYRAALVMQSALFMNNLFRQSSEVLYMKKTLLAAALLAGFTGAAQAQTAITLYGVIDVGVGYNKVKPSKDILDNASRVGLIQGIQSGARWGLRGGEDLGDGVRAVFTLESGFDATSGVREQGGRLFGRQATLGMASDAMGTLEFGRQTNIASEYMNPIDPLGSAFGQANIGHALSAANTVRYDNMVLYHSPDFDGFQAGLGYTFSADSVANGDRFRTSDNLRALTAGLRYANGPLNIAVTYDQLRQVHGFGLNGTTPTGAKVDHSRAKPRSYAVGVAYDFDVIKLSAAYAHTVDGWFAGQDAPGLGNFSGDNSFNKDFQANSYMLGASMPLGSDAVLMSSWQRVDPRNDKLTGDDHDLNVYSLAYTYAFSKRSNLYAFASYAQNHDFVHGAQSTATGLGLRHSF